MTAKKQSNRHPMGEISFDPLNEPRTIPTGWQVGAFYQPEQDSQDTTGSGEQFNHPDNETRKPYGSTQDPV